MYLADNDLNLAYTCSQESYKSYQSSWHPKSWLLGLPDPLEEKKIPFLGKGARREMHTLTSKAHFSSILRPILMNSFSVTPYKYNKCNLCIRAPLLIALCSYRRFNKWSDFFGSPGTSNRSKSRGTKKSVQMINFLYISHWTRVSCFMTISSLIFMCHLCQLGPKKLESKGSMIFMDRQKSLI